ncbi:MAG: DNRLRE domain-containing protein [Chloroflexota bacterium]
MRLRRTGQRMVFLLVLIASLVAGACGGGGTANNAPQISSVTCSPASVGKGGSTTVACEASDPDGDPLTYDWTATKGTFSGTGATVTWMAPNEDGAYTIRVTVSDGKGGTAEETCGISVAASLRQVNITSLPEGANVFVDGEDTGKVTPCVLDLAPGSYTLRLSYYHYKWIEDTVTVGAEPIIYKQYELRPATETTRTIQPKPGEANDAYVFENAKDTNFGNEAYLFVGGNLAHQFYRTLIEFDVSTIVSTAVVTEAYVELFYSESDPQLNAMMAVYEVKNDWDEDHINWANAPTPAAEAVDTVNVPAVASQGWIAWDVTILVRGWLDGSVANYGVLLKDADESTVKSLKGFYSSSHSLFERRPRLVVTYFDPVPSTP